MFPAIKSPIRAIDVHSTRTTLYLIGFDADTCTHRIMTVNRPLQGGGEGGKNQTGNDVPELEIKCDPQTYTQVSLDRYIRELGEATTLETICTNADCIFGFIKLLESYYLIMVTKKKKVATLHGHSIYTITETQTIPITFKLKASNEESTNNV